MLFLLPVMLFPPPLAGQRLSPPRADEASHRPTPSLFPFPGTMTSPCLLGPSDAPVPLRHHFWPPSAVRVSHENPMLAPGRCSVNVVLTWAGPSQVASVSNVAGWKFRGQGSEPRRSHHRSCLLPQSQGSRGASLTHPPCAQAHSVSSPTGTRNAALSITRVAFELRTPGKGQGHRSGNVSDSLPVLSQTLKSWKGKGRNQHF